MMYGRHCSPMDPRGPARWKTSRRADEFTPDASMKAVDTNVLVRLLTGDDAKQTAAAEAFVAGGAWVSLLVLAETVWVLSAVYDRKDAALADSIDMLLKHRDLTLQDPDVVAAALIHYRNRPAIGFSDCLVLEIARKNGHLPLGTFDRELGKIEGAQRL